MNWQALLEQHFRFCINCAKILPRVPLFCKTCEDKFFQNTTVTTQLISPENFINYYLFTWTGENNHKLYPVIMSLKGGGLKNFNETLAWKLCKGRKIKINREALIVPAPRKHGAKPDHAYQLAEVLGGLWQVSVYDGLVRASEVVDQKRQKLTERKKLKLIAKHPARLNKLKDRQIIFVDDIFTTGSTARAARRVFKKNKNFCVVTVFYRPPGQ